MESGATTTEGAARRNEGGRIRLQSKQPAHSPTRGTLPDTHTRAAVGGAETPASASCKQRASDAKAGCTRQLHHEPAAAWTQHTSRGSGETGAGDAGLAGAAGGALTPRSWRSPMMRPLQRTRAIEES